MSRVALSLAWTQRPPIHIERVAVVSASMRVCYRCSCPGNGAGISTSRAGPTRPLAALLTSHATRSQRGKKGAAGWHAPAAGRRVRDDCPPEASAPRSTAARRCRCPRRCPMPACPARGSRARPLRRGRPGGRAPSRAAPRIRRAALLRRWLRSLCQRAPAGPRAARSLAAERRSRWVSSSPSASDEPQAIESARPERQSGS